jgi:hypothetical protein
MGNNQEELFDLDTYVALRKAAPRVTVVHFDAAQIVMFLLLDFSRANNGHVDINGKQYWQASLKDIHAQGKLGEAVSINTVGKSCRLMGLETWRKGDGYYVAFSNDQLAILKRLFRV